MKAYLPQTRAGACAVLAVRLPALGAQGCCAAEPPAMHGTDIYFLPYICMRRIISGRRRRNASGCPATGAVVAALRSGGREACCWIYAGGWCTSTK